MCNPRRVLVRLAQLVREEWSRTVDARITEQTELSAEATLETRIDLAAELGDVALQELHRLLGEGYGGWHIDGDTYRLALAHGIALRYHPDSGRLQVQAHLSETIAVAANASAAATGVAEGAVEVEGVGVWYDNDHDGSNEAYAREQAEHHAQAQLAVAHATFVAEQQQAALATAQRTAEAQARHLAQARLREERERRQAMLDEQLETILRDSEIHVQSAIGALLGQTYRRAIIRLVTEGGGAVVQDLEHGEVIDLVARI